MKDRSLKMMDDLISTGFMQWNPPIKQRDGLSQCKNGMPIGIWKFKAWKGQIM